MRIFMHWAYFVLLITGFSLVTAQDDTNQVARNVIPDVMPQVSVAGYDMTNIMLLGSDTTNPANSGRTDVIMIVSINRTEATVALLSIPRDLYVYIPDLGMNRINTAYSLGEQIEGGTGAQLLMKTIEYNLGLTVDRYARVDFIGFKQIVDALGGIQVPVDCAIQDWRLREPDLDPTIEDHWEMFTLPIGMQAMDGDLALWYVRSRRTSNDIDRGQRQQDVVRALWQHIRDLGLIGQMSELWPQLTTVVETDITLSDMLGLSSLIVTMNTNQVSSFNFRLNTDILDRQTDEGARVLVPHREPIQELMQNFVTPPTKNQLFGDQFVVKITNATGEENLDKVMANRLVSAGFLPVVTEEMTDVRQITRIIDYTGRTKGGGLGELQRLFRVGEGQIDQQPDAGRSHDYEVILGQSFYACTRNVIPPA